MATSFPLNKEETITSKRKSYSPNKDALNQVVLYGTRQEKGVLTGGEVIYDWPQTIEVADRVFTLDHVQRGPNLFPGFFLWKDDPALKNEWASYTVKKLADS